MSDGENIQPKRYPQIAAAFLIVGVLVLGVLGFLVVVGNAMAGAGDGTSGGRTAAIVIIVPYASYFGCGIIASLIAKRAVRKFLAVIGHLLPFVAMFAELDRDSAAFFIIVNVVLFVPFGFAWRTLLRQI